MPHRPPTRRVAITDALFAQICRATPQEAGNLSMLLTMDERAAQALSCNARTHLRAQGTCHRERLQPGELGEGG